MLDDKQLGEKLEQSPAPRVTKEYIESRIKRKVVSKLPFTETVTIAHIELDNGFSVRGEAACVNPENYNAEIGEKIAYDNAFNKLWAFFGFLLAETGELPPVLQETGEEVEIERVVDEAA